MYKNYNIVFTTLAFNQTVFFVGLAKELEKYGNKVHIITFHEDSCDYIKKSNISYYNVFEYKKDLKDEDICALFSNIVEKYNIENPNLILSHEKVAFNIKNTDEIIKKYINYFNALENIFTSIKSVSNTPLITIQELA